MLPLNALIMLPLNALIMLPLNACIISLIVYIQPLLAAAPDSLEPTVQ